MVLRNTKIKQRSALFALVAWLATALDSQNQIRSVLLDTTVASEPGAQPPTARRKIAHANMAHARQEVTALQAFLSHFRVLREHFKIARAKLSAENAALELIKTPKVLEAARIALQATILIRAQIFAPHVNMVNTSLTKDRTPASRARLDTTAALPTRRIHWSVRTVTTAHPGRLLPLSILARTARSTAEPC
jgi:hypothetical protein